jgi:hypothetical protein
VLVEGLLVLLFCFVELDLAHEASLLPKDRNGPAYLSVGITIVPKEYQLLCLTKISNVSFKINAPRVKSSSSLSPTPSRNKSILQNRSYIHDYLPLSVILKLRIDPWINPTNHLRSFNFYKCLAMFKFHRNFFFAGHPNAWAPLERLKSYLNAK